MKIDAHARTNTISSIVNMHLITPLSPIAAMLQLKIVDFGDEYTRRIMGSARERTLVLIKDSDLAQSGTIIDALNMAGLTLAGARMGFLAAADAEELLGAAGDSLCAGPVLALEFLGASAISLAKGRPSIYASPDTASAGRQLSLVFGSQSLVQANPAFKNSTLCLIKPHAVAAGTTGKILDDIINGGYSIGALQTFALDTASATEFLEVYKGVVTEYPSMVQALTAGILLAIEVVGSADVQKSFRDFSGPSDPEIGRHIRKSTLRAKYGKDKISNAVHCTDLAEDAQLEVEYFFKILA